MQITIKPAKPDDASLLSEISCKTFYDTFHAQNTKEDMELFLNTTFNVQTLHDELLDEQNYFFLAKNDDEVSGYLKLSIGECPAELKNSDALEIARLYVLEEKLGTGVGKALMKFAIAFAKEKQKKMVYLGVWEHNERAIRFYKKFGFGKFAEHVFMVGNDPQIDWLMKKEIG